MALRKLTILLLHIGISLALPSHHSHTIPVEGYDTELQDLGQHVEIPETPVKVIKITKTVAVKIPVPYPVKVVEKVPYPVHVNKPYPVPVPHIVHTPHAESPHGEQEHHALTAGNGGFNTFHGNPHNTYQVQENGEHSDVPLSYENDGSSHSGSYGSYSPSIGDEHAEYPSSSYQPQSNHYSNQQVYNSPEPQNYNAIQSYINNLNPQEHNDENHDGYYYRH